MKEGSQMTPKEKTGNVIKGPWAKRKVKPLDEEALARREDMAFADDLCQTLLIQMSEEEDNNFTAEIKEDAVQKFIDMMESEDDDGPEIP